MELPVDTYPIAVGVLIMAIGIYCVRAINRSAEGDDTDDDNSITELLV